MNFLIEFAVNDDDLCLIVSKNLVAEFLWYIYWKDDTIFWNLKRFAICKKLKRIKHDKDSPLPRFDI